jgi:hypothetical protein
VFPAVLQDGKTALEFAESYGRSAVVAVLKEQYVARGLSVPAGTNPGEWLMGQRVDVEEADSETSEEFSSSVSDSDSN